MGKGDKRGKKQPLPAVEPTRKRSKSGAYKRSAEDGTRHDPMRPALEARAKALGKKYDRASKKQLGDPLLETQIGKVIYSNAPETKAKVLGDAWREILRIVHTWRQTQGLPPGHAKGSMPELVRERVESEGGHTVDLRSTEQKAEDAKRKHADLMRSLSLLPLVAQAYILGAIDDSPERYWRDDRATPDGLAVMSALWVFVDRAK